MTAVACALLGGAMFFFSMEINTVWWLAWIAPVPLLWLAYGRAPGWQVFAASFAAYAIGQLSLFQAYMNMAPMIATVIVVTGLLYAAATLFARLARRNLPSWAALFAFPALWTTVEYLKAFSSAGGFGAFAYSQLPAPVLIQSASLFGLWSVTFLICTVASAVALVLRDGRRAALPGLAVAVLFAANLGFGLARLNAQPSGPVVRVAAAGNGETRLLFTEAAARDTSQQYTKVAASLATKGARAIVFPEEIAVLKPEWQNATKGFARLAQTTGTRIVVGYRQIADAPRNVAFTFSRDGVARYVKRHLIPGLEPVVPGHGPGLLGQGRAVAICKDMDFGGTIRSDARHGIRLMFVPAWDFGVDGALHADMAIMRGVENGFAMARSARNGLLTITDAQGRILASAKSQGGMTSIIADVPMGTGPTLYTSIGDLFAQICAAIAALMATVMIIRARLPKQA